MTTDIGGTLPACANREAYIEWRANWREMYKNLSAEIRTMKRNIAQEQKDGNYVGPEMARLACRRGTAHEMMETRMEAKAISRYQREMRLQQAA